MKKNVESNGGGVQTCATTSEGTDGQTACRPPSRARGQTRATLHEVIKNPYKSILMRVVMKSSFTTLLSIPAMEMDRMSTSYGPVLSTSNITPL